MGIEQLFDNDLRSAYKQNKELHKMFDKYYIGKI